jgi:7 transmembrane helices usually fused to an inactive transglutaminase/Transglutaminase-like superfamily
MLERQMWNRHREAILVALIMVFVGSVCMGLRIKYAYVPASGRGEAVWRLTYDISFPASKEGRIYIAIPDNTPQRWILRESFSHQGIWMDVLRSRRTLEREAVIVPVVGYKQARFAAEFEVHFKPDAKLEPSAPKTRLTAEETAHYLQNEGAIQLGSPLVADILNRLKSARSNKGKLLQDIFDHCSENILQGDENSPSDAAGTLQHGLGTALGQARAMVALCRSAKIPARLVTGFPLDSRAEARPHYWVEAFSKNVWRPYDVENGYSGTVPITFLPIRRDGIRIVRASGPVEYQAKYSIRRVPPHPTLTGLPVGRFWSIADLIRLPLGMQEVLSLLLLLPLGALVTAVFRNIIGIRTFGTFTPCLIALGFVRADWRTGAIVFFVVLGVGIFARLLLTKLQLLLVARLGIIVTLVVLCMVSAVSIMDYFGLTPSASAVLLPVVILTMMIERFNITAEEDGHPEALKVFAGTLVVAISCFFVLRIEGLGRLVLTFPEMLFIIAAALLLIGRYSGYRLTELWRFRDISRS